MSWLDKIKNRFLNKTKLLPKGQQDEIDLDNINLDSLLNTKAPDISAKGENTLVTDDKEKPISVNEQTENFKERISRMAEENLSSNQYKIKFANRLGINPQILSLPGVKDFIFSLNMFDEIEDKKSFKQAVKQIQDRLEINFDNGSQDEYNITIRDKSKKASLIIDHNKGKDSIFIARNTYNGLINSEKRIYDMGIETERFESMSSEYRKHENHFKRDKEQVEIVTDGLGTYDLSLSEGDIATLDGAAKHNKWRDFSEDEDIRKQRIAEKVDKSSKANTLRKYYNVQKSSRGK